MAHYNIICLEGGGAKGIYEMGVLQRLEENANKKLIQFIKMITSTSVGSVNGSLICTGKKSIKEWANLEMKELPRVFKKRRFGLGIPLYDSKNYENIYNEYVGKDFLMCNLPMWFMCTSVDRCKLESHFFKSWEKKDGTLLVTEAVKRSFAAAYFFGSIIDEQSNTIFMDGGMGNENLPLIETYIECLRQGWNNNGNTVHILAIGCGRSDETVSFCDAKKANKFVQMIDDLKTYIDPSDGGLGRQMSTKQQVKNLEEIVKYSSWLTFQWIDWFGLSKNLDKMDNVGARKEYYDKGLEHGQKIDLSLFKI